MAGLGGIETRLEPPNVVRGARLAVVFAAIAGFAPDVLEEAETPPGPEALKVFMAWGAVLAPLAFDAIVEAVGMLDKAWVVNFTVNPSSSSSSSPSSA
jgi:hypothetical protein